MKQYCRYCAFCSEGDVFYCSDHDEVLSEGKIKRVNHCKDFTFTEEDVFNPDHKYTPRVIKPRVDDGQLKFEF